MERLQSPRNLYATLPGSLIRAAIPAIRAAISRGSNAAFSVIGATPFVKENASLHFEYASHFRRAPGRRRAASRTGCSTGAPALGRTICDSLKFGGGTADNLDMGNTPLLQRRTPGSRTEKVGE